MAQRHGPWQKKLESKLNGMYTWMLRAVLNKSWKQHSTKEKLYGKNPPVWAIIRKRRTRYARHCYQSKNELASDLLLWMPIHGHSSIGRTRQTYINQLARDVGILIEDLKNAVEDRNVWRERADLVRAIRPTRCWWWWEKFTHCCKYFKTVLFHYPWW